MVCVGNMLQHIKILHTTFGYLGIYKTQQNTFYGVAAAHILACKPGQHRWEMPSGNFKN